MEGRDERGDLEQWQQGEGERWRESRRGVGTGRSDERVRLGMKEKAGQN